MAVKLPPGIEPVENFESDRFLGKWYEIARLDHSFERGLDQVSAEYSLKRGGGIKVVNSGYKTASKKWKSATGKAYFVKDESVGFLKVSFFGPFYGAYGVFELGEDYEYAFIAGDTTKYLWFLARTPTVSDELKADFESSAAALGFNVDNLIYVDQSLPPEARPEKN